MPTKQQQYGGYLGFDSEQVDIASVPAKLIVFGDCSSSIAVVTKFSQTQVELYDNLI